MATQKLTFYQGIILNPLDDKRCDFYPDGMLVIKGKGSKAKIVDLLPKSKAQKKYPEISSANTVICKNSVIMPGFFDMHFHWVQDDVRQMPKDSLLEWLEKYTFPTEMKYASKLYAKKKAKEFFKKLVSVGTLGGACYSSVHEHAVEEAMGQAKGDFVIGNVLMNMNSPKKLTQGAGEALSLTKRLIKKFGSRHSFTPRFAITTAPEVMIEGSRMADKAKCFKQTHLSETTNEIDYVLSLYRKMPGFEDVSSYTEIYQRTGMLGKRSLMGHGIHLSDKELNILRKTKTAIIHCPTSNAPIEQQGLGSGLFDFKKIEKNKIRWALGSDIGGGPFLSMFDVMRSFVEQNKQKSGKEATYVKSLYRATLAGAEILRLDTKTGNFAKGKEANFVVVPLKSKKELKSAEEVLELLINPHRTKRVNYETMVDMVCYQGETLFRRATTI